MGHDDDPADGRTHAGRAEALWIALGVLLVVASLATGEAARTAADGSRVALVGLQALCTATAFAIPQLRQYRQSRAEATAEEREVEARVETRIAINDALDPVLRLLGRLAVDPDPQARSAMAAQAVSLVLKTASEFIGPERARACWFRLEPGPPQRLVPTEHAGRAGGPSTVFLAGTVAGDAAIELVARGGALRCEDVVADPPPGWGLDADPAYATFLAVATRGEDAAFGMLTLDALEAGTLSTDDEGLLRLMSDVLALALRLGRPPDGPPAPSPTSPPDDRAGAGP